MKYKIVVVSLFAGIDLFLKGLVKAGMSPAFACEVNKYAARIHAANFFYPDGQPVLTPPVETTREEIEKRQAETDRDLKPEWWKKDGKYFRHKRVEEIDGREIRKLCEEKFGKNIKIVLIGGPPCQDFSPLNLAVNRGRGILTLEFLRIVEELQPDVAVMEEVKAFLSKKHKALFKAFIAKASTLNYNFAHMVMNALHYWIGLQSRERLFIPFVRKDVGNTVFPEPSVGMMKRFGEIFDADRFYSGHFTDKIKTRNHFVGTVTSGSPLWHKTNGIKIYFTPFDKLKLQGVIEGDYIIPAGIPDHQLHIAAGNGVCVNVAFAWGKTIIEKILRLKPDGNGYFVPIDNDTDSSPDNDDSIAPTDTPTEPSPGNGDSDEHSDNPPEPSPEAPTDNGSNNPPVATSTQTSDYGNIDLHINTLSELLSDTVDTVAPVDILLPEHTSISIDSNVSTEAIIQSEIQEVAVYIQSLTPKRIISSQQLQLMHFDTLCFEGRWHTLLGDTSLNFFCVIHGLPGHGKSTFAIQLAKYLADNFGKAIYISGEEGFSKTFKDKFINSNAASNLLDVADLRTYEDILRVVPAESYRFIFIDSLDNMKITATKMKAIRAKYKNAALITISQSTKGGLMRGSQEIIHDSDIAIEVVNLLATTTKNRFKEKGMTYEVFPGIEDAEYTEIE